MKRVGKTFLTSVKAKTRIIMGLARKPQVVWYGHLKTALYRFHVLCPEGQY